MTRCSDYVLTLIIWTLVVASPASKNTLGQDRSSAQKFLITENAFTVERTSSSGTGLWMWWIAVIRNPNPDYYCQSPAVTVTARDARDELVGTYDKNMGAFLAPGGVIAYGDNLEVTAMPAKIEITPARCYWKKVSMSSVRPLDFRPQKVKLSQTRFDWNIQGEITNPFDEDIDFLKGAVLFRDKSGKLLGGDLVFIRNLPAKGTKPFMERLYFKGAMPEKFEQFDFLVFPSSFDWEKIVR